MASGESQHRKSPQNFLQHRTKVRKQSHLGLSFHQKVIFPPSSPKRPCVTNVTTHTSLVVSYNCKGTKYPQLVNFYHYHPRNCNIIHIIIVVIFVRSWDFEKERKDSETRILKSHHKRAKTSTPVFGSPKIPRGHQQHCHQSTIIWCRCWKDALKAVGSLLLFLPSFHGELLAYL